MGMEKREGCKKIRPRESHWMYQERTEVAQVTGFGAFKDARQRAVWKEDFVYPPELSASCFQGVW